MEPETRDSVAEAEPPISERSAHADDRSPLTSEMVQVRAVVVVASAATEAGEKAHAEIDGGVDVARTVSEAVFVPVPAAESVAVVVMVFAPVDVPVATVMFASVQVEPDELTRAAVDEPPMPERLTVTVERFSLASVTVQVRVVVELPLATTEAGENAQADIEGFGSVTVRLAVESVRLAAASMADMGMEWAEMTVDVATVMAVFL